MWRNALFKETKEADIFDTRSGIEPICDFQCEIDDIFNTIKTWSHIKFIR